MGERDLDSFANLVSDRPEVMECYLMTGEFDYLLRVVGPDLHTYHRFLDQKLTTIEGISHTKSSFSLKPVCYKTHLPLDHVV
jgi:DNA-binding Lrp family transcriptional regulator